MGIKQESILVIDIPQPQEWGPEWDRHDSVRGVRTEFGSRFSMLPGVLLTDTIIEIINFRWYLTCLNSILSSSINVAICIVYNTSRCVRVASRTRHISSSFATTTTTATLDSTTVRIRDNNYVLCNSRNVYLNDINQII